MSDDDRRSDIESPAGKRAHKRARERIRRDNMRESYINLRDMLPTFQGDKLRAGKRAHHNALERKRRNSIRDSFITLKNALPIFQHDKVRGSRQNIPEKAAEYIMNMRKKNSAHQQDIDVLKQQNKVLEDRISSIMKARATGNFAAVLEATHLTNNRIGPASVFDGDSDSDEISDDSDDSKDVPRKKVKF